MELTDEKPAPGATPEPDGLDHLLTQAENIDAGRKPTADAITVEALPTNTAAELKGVLTMARLMVAPMFAWWVEFKTVWSDDALEGIAQGGGAVMDRHGWSVGEALGQWGPYLALVGAVAPPAFVTYQAIKAREKEAARGRPEQAAD